MSSPVRHPQDLDAALRYAPPWARKVSGSAAAAPPAGRPAKNPQIDDDEPAFDGDRAMLALRERLSLDPEIVPPPPLLLGSGLRLDQMAFRLCAVAAIAALAAGVVAWLPARSGEDKVVQAAAVPAVVPMPVKVAQVSTPAEAPPQQTTVVASPVLASALSAMSDSAISDGAMSDSSTSEPLSQPAPVAAAPQQAKAPQGADKPVALEAAEIAMLVKRGKEQLMNGDISAARLLLQRAAEAGNAEAALVLGSTFDPLVVGRMGAVGVETDVAKAREWYQRAAEDGSRLASQQLANLAAAGQ